MKSGEGQTDGQIDSDPVSWQTDSQKIDRTDSRTGQLNWANEDSQAWPANGQTQTQARPNDRRPLTGERQWWWPMANEDGRQPDRRTDIDPMTQPSDPDPVTKADWRTAQLDRRTKPSDITQTDLTEGGPSDPMTDIIVSDPAQTDGQQLFKPIEWMTTQINENPVETQPRPMASQLTDPGQWPRRPDRPNEASGRTVDGQPMTARRPRTQWPNWPSPDPVEGRPARQSGQWPRPSGRQTWPRPARTVIELLLTQLVVVIDPLLLDRLLLTNWLNWPSYYWLTAQYWLTQAPDIEDEAVDEGQAPNDPTQPSPIDPTQPTLNWQLTIVVSWQWRTPVADPDQPSEDWRTDPASQTETRTQWRSPLTDPGRRTDPDSPVIEPSRQWQ